jgi:hypothetical protein
VGTGMSSAASSGVRIGDGNLRRPRTGRVDHRVGVGVGLVRFDGSVRVFVSWARGVLRCSAGLAPATVDVRCLTSLIAFTGCCAARRGSVFHCLTSVSRVWRTCAMGTPSRVLMALLSWYQCREGRPATTRAASRRASADGRLASRSSSSRSASGWAAASARVSAVGPLR